MKHTPVWAGLLLLLCSTSGFAKTVLTEKNLDTYMQVTEELDATAEDSFDTDETTMPLTYAAHCDWQRHYQQAVASAPAKEVADVEAAAKHHGMSPVKYFEFTHKMQWMMMEEMQMMLKSSESLLKSLPTESRTELEAEIANQNNVIELLNRCMTDEDKKAAQRLKPILMKKAMQMMEN
ncbi:MAG: hypothetical protein WBO13_12880 [Vibrio fluvialis]